MISNRPLLGFALLLAACGSNATTSGPTGTSGGSGGDASGPGVTSATTTSANTSGTSSGTGSGTGSGGGIDPTGKLNCAPHPSMCGYPDETNTGVPSTVTLTPSPALNVTMDGAVISGLDIADGINVSANNVTIKNVRVTGGGESWGLVVIHPGAHNTLIEDSELRGTDNGNGGIQSAITDQGDNSTTLRRVNFYYCSQCITSDNAVVEDSYFHDQAQWIDPNGA